MKNLDQKVGLAISTLDRVDRMKFGGLTFPETKRRMASNHKGAEMGLAASYIKAKSISVGDLEDHDSNINIEQLYEIVCSALD